MRKATLARIVIYMALGTLLLGAKCPGIPSTEEVELTLVTEEFIEFKFEARGSLNVDSGTETIDINDIRQELDDAGVDLSLVDTLRVASVEYGALHPYTDVPDRRIVNATVSVERTDTGASAVLISGLSADVVPLLGILVPAPINAAGIAFLNDLMDDILVALRTGFPTEFEVAGSSSGVSEPTEETTHFDWRVRIYYHISGRVLTEVPRF